MAIIQKLLAGREINDSMGSFVADDVLELLRKSNKQLKQLKVLVLGVTFKENCPDYRNTKVVDVISKLKENLLEVDAYDPWVNSVSFYEDYKLKILNKIPDKIYNAVILAVAHDSFKNIDINKITSDGSSVVYDIKGFLDKKIVTKRL